MAASQVLKILALCIFTIRNVLKPISYSKSELVIVNNVQIKTNLQYLAETTQLFDLQHERCGDQRKLGTVRTYKVLKPTIKSLIICILLRGGDIEANPGPRTRIHKNKCTKCEKGVISTSKAVSCDSCNEWTHIRCTGNITNEDYEKLTHIKNFSFFCEGCTLKDLGNGEVVDCTQSDSIESNNINVDTSANITQNSNDAFQLPTESSDDQYQCFSKKGMHYLHLNARSLLPKISELRHIANRTKAAVISVTETWLDSSVTNSEINIEGCNIVRRDRNRQGGGVCTYINERYAFSTKALDQPDKENESIWIDIYLPKTKPITVGTCYRPPI
jgi:hypothetical protein